MDLAWKGLPNLLAAYVVKAYRNVDDVAVLLARNALRSGDMDLSSMVVYDVTIASAVHHASGWAAAAMPAWGGGSAGRVHGTACRGCAAPPPPHAATCHQGVPRVALLARLLQVYRWLLRHRLGKPRPGDGGTRGLEHTAVRAQLTWMHIKSAVCASIADEDSLPCRVKFAAAEIEEIEADLRTKGGMCPMAQQFAARE